MKQWLLYTKKQLILPKMSNICTCRSKSGLFCFLYAHRIKGVKKRSYNFVHLFESRACADYKRYIWVFIWNVSAAWVNPLCVWVALLCSSHSMQLRPSEGILEKILICFGYVNIRNQIWMFILLLILIYLHFRCTSNCWEGTKSLLTWPNDVWYTIDRRDLNTTNVTTLL